MTIRLGAVGYLNARPLVYGLEREPRVDLRFDLPSECARLLHERAIDVGLIPSVEYLRGPSPYAIVPGPVVASNGPVASVAIYTRRDPRDVRTIAMDTSSRTSVALASVLLRRVYNVPHVQPIAMAPDLPSMLAAADAAVIIGDNALFLDHTTHKASKIDLGEIWTESTGLPFVYAFWAGWPEAVAPDDARLLQQARDAGIAHVDDISRRYFDDPRRQEIGTRYLRDNIRYFLGAEEYEGLTAFYRYAAELALVPHFDGTLRVYDAEDSGAR